MPRTDADRVARRRFTRIVAEIPRVLPVAHQHVHGVFALADLAHAATDAALLAGASPDEVRSWATLAAETDAAILALATGKATVTVDIHGVRWTLPATGQHPAADWRRWVLGWSLCGLAGLSDAPIVGVSVGALFPAPTGWDHWATALASTSLGLPVEPHLARAAAELAGDPEAELPLRFFAAWNAGDPDEAEELLATLPSTEAGRLQLAGLAARARAC